MGGSDGKETKQLFSVLGEIVPYKKFKKRMGTRKRKRTKKRNDETRSEEEMR